MQKKEQLISFGVPIATIILVIFLAGQQYYRLDSIDSRVAKTEQAIECIQKEIKTLEILMSTQSENNKFIVERLTDIKGTLQKHVEK